MSEYGVARDRSLSIGGDSGSVNIATYGCASSKGGGGKVISVPSMQVICKLLFIFLLQR